MIYNQITNTVTISDFEKKSETIYLSKSIIKTIDFDGVFFEKKVIIEDCIINRILIHASRFKYGFEFINNHIEEEVVFQIGGYNENEIIFKSNIFKSQVVFFDCYFIEILRIEGNVFLNGFNLIDDKKNEHENTFVKTPLLSDNIIL